MTWSGQQRLRLADEYARIGYVPGEHWPAPPPSLTPDQLLAMFASIPDGAGREGYMQALARHENSD
jgi:hypothetical protein